MLKLYSFRGIGLVKRIDIYDKRKDKKHCNYCAC